MKLWKLTQTANKRYAAYRAAVVVAATADDARRTAPVLEIAYAWAPPEQVQAEYLGEAHDGLAAGVVLAALYSQ